MAQKESQSQQPEASSFLVPAEFAAMGKQHVREFVIAQKELLDKLQETNRRWFERMQSEVNVTSELD